MNHTQSSLRLATIILPVSYPAVIRPQDDKGFTYIINTITAINIQSVCILVSTMVHLTHYLFTNKSGKWWYTILIPCSDSRRFHVLLASLHVFHAPSCKMSAMCTEWAIVLW